MCNTLRYTSLYPQVMVTRQMSIRYARFTAHIMVSIQILCFCLYIPATPMKIHGPLLLDALLFLIHSQFIGHAAAYTAESLRFKQFTALGLYVMHNSCLSNDKDSILSLIPSQSYRLVNTACKTCFSLFMATTSRYHNSYE